MLISKLAKHKHNLVNNSNKEIDNLVEPLTGTIKTISETPVLNKPEMNKPLRTIEPNTIETIYRRIITPEGDSFYQLTHGRFVPASSVRLISSSVTDRIAHNWDPIGAPIKIDDTYNLRDAADGQKTNHFAYKNKIYYAISTEKDEQNRIWYELGDTGWVPQSAVTAIAPVHSKAWVSKMNQQDISKVIQLAKKQIGKPYVWDAKGPDSFDCSGFMNYIFKQATGQNIGAFTGTQKFSGQDVDLNQLQPGDLLFWGPKDASYHVAMYLGNHQYINALKPGTNIKIDPITDNFKPSFAKRIIN